MATDPSITPWIGMIGVTIGALISGGFLLFSQTLTRRSEERRQRRELAVNTALANWKRDMETADEMSRNGVTGIAVAPLDHYIIHMVKLSDLIERKDLTEEDIANELKRIRHASRKHFEAAKEEDQKRNK